MKIKLLHALATLGALVLRADLAAPPASRPAPITPVTLSSTIRTLRWAAPIHPMAVDTICGAVRRAEDKRQLFVLELDTPGGMGSSMDEIIKCMENAKTPVAVYVYPSEDRARADSAGAFIAMAVLGLVLKAVGSFK